MAQKQMPELQLRQELRSRFPEINGTTVMKVMRMYNNDSEKCIQHLEQESQKSLFAAPSPGNNHHSQPTNHNNNNFNHSPHSYPNRSNNSIHQPPVGTQQSGMSRYQEVPVKHETTHISTVQHTVGSPAIPPKPRPPPPTEVSNFAHPTMPPVPNRPVLLIRPHDFTPFVDSSPRTQTDIPNIRCAPTSFRGGGVGGGSSGSPESRRPVRVINVHGYPSGGTVTSGVMVSPTTAGSNPRFRVVLGDGGGVCLPASSAPITSPTSNPYRFTGQTYMPPRQWAQETERQGVHSSSIFIDAPRRTNIQESGSDPPAQSGYRPVPPFPESSGPVSLPPRTAQPLTVSLSSHATNQLPQERSPLPYASYNPGHPSPQYPNTSSWMNSAPAAGNRFAQEGASPSPSRPYNISTGLHKLTIGTGAVGPPSQPPSSSPSPSNFMLSHPGYGGAVQPKSPSLRSMGSSTSRSNSMDSEHGSVHSPGDPPHLTLSHPLRGMAGKSIVGIGVGASLPVMSPASSQSSLSSESPARDHRDLNSQRPRSGSMQEEAAYSQALLHHQQLRLDKLTEDIADKRHMLQHLRELVSDAEKSKIEKKSLRKTFPTADDIARLCESNRRLQTDIQMYLNEIDMYKNGQTPFSVIDPMGQQNFFNNMPTGPNDLFSRQQNQHNQQHLNNQQNPRHRTPPPEPPPQPPPRPPPPRPQRFNSDDLSQTVPAPLSVQTQGGGSADSEEGEKWACTACTFENHPALKKCEICEMPRMMAGS